MTHREKFIAALERKPIKGLVPHFELVFFLTMESFGKVHPNHRSYHQWDQMSRSERELHRDEMAEIFINTARQYDHSAIFCHPNPNTLEETKILIEKIRKKSGEDFFLMIHGDATYSIPNGTEMTEFIYRIADEPQKMKDTAEERVDRALEKARKLRDHGILDGFALCADYCFNTGPFLSPRQFSEFISPYLKKLIKGYREMGFYTIKHTDGNIMPILDQLLEAGPHALHSLDPQGGVDIGEVKRIAGDRVCLIGNVNCGLLQNGTDEEVRDSVLYSLRNGMPGGGYIFSTSNCIYTGMDFKRYDLMLSIWKENGIYQ
ncbi:MAG: uroporphyrinogen decarboxylase family protein [Spirochaetia bacterium]